MIKLIKKMIKKQKDKKLWEASKNFYLEHCLKKWRPEARGIFKLGDLGHEFKIEGFGTITSHDPILMLNEKFFSKDINKSGVDKE